MLRYFESTSRILCPDPDHPGLWRHAPIGSVLELERNGDGKRVIASVEAEGVANYLFSPERADGMGRWHKNWWGATPWLPVGEGRVPAGVLALVGG